MGILRIRYCESYGTFIIEYTECSSGINKNGPKNTYETTDSDLFFDMDSPQELLFVAHKNILSVSNKPTFFFFQKVYYSIHCSLIRMISLLDYSQLLSELHCENGACIEIVSDNAKCHSILHDDTTIAKSVSRTHSGGKRDRWESVSHKSLDESLTLLTLQTAANRLRKPERQYSPATPLLPSLPRKPERSLSVDLAVPSQFGSVGDLVRLLFDSLHEEGLLDTDDDSGCC